MPEMLNKAASAFTAIEKDVMKGVTMVSHLYTSAETKLHEMMKEEPEAVAVISDLLEKGEAFLAAAAPAMSDKGLSLPADCAAYAALQAFLKSFESAVVEFRTIVAAVK